VKVVNIEELRNLKEKLAVAIGFFDGIHLGHQKVINHVSRYAKENRAKSMVITFDKSPKVVLGNVPNEGCLTPIAEKLRILEGMGIDYALILTFDATFLNLSADDFINEYLLKINASYVSVGFDFRFGKGGFGDVALLASCGQFKVEVTEPVLMSGVKVSTRLIKKHLNMGELDLAYRMLGRNYSVSGHVEYGRRLGHKIGFPTANLMLDEDYLLPLRGVYATKSYIGNACFVSMTNIGFNPTVNLKASISVETHILDFDAAVYGKKLRVELISKIRDEIKFDNLDALVVQLTADKEAVKLMSI